MTQLCVSTLTIIPSDNGLLPGWHQDIIWTNAGIFLIGPLGTNFSEMAAILSPPQCVNTYQHTKGSVQNKLVAYELTYQ